MCVLYVSVFERVPVCVCACMCVCVCVQAIKMSDWGVSLSLCTHEHYASSCSESVQVLGHCGFVVNSPPSVGNVTGDRRLPCLKSYGIVSKWGTTNIRSRLSQCSSMCIQTYHGIEQYFPLWRWGSPSCVLHNSMQFTVGTIQAYIKHYSCLWCHMTSSWHHFLMAVKYAQ